MSDLDRLIRVANSWLGKVRKGKKRRISVYQEDDALMILNDLGMLMSPSALEYIAGNSTLREDFLMQIYAAEDELGIDLVRDNVMIDPALEPKVYEEGNKIVFTVSPKRNKEYVIAEFERK
jgi:hypothetical protein